MSGKGNTHKTFGIVAAYAAYRYCISARGGTNVPFHAETSILKDYSLAHRNVSSPDAYDVAAACDQLCNLPGIGDWTAQYIAMRALRWPDAFPAGDVALQKALGVTSTKAAEQAANSWRPWRSYAVLRAWHGRVATLRFKSSITH